ncbi:MAG: acetylglutamate kinase [Chloroflexi bacterium]|nr:MAG: acetylglutamate kinase [Ktedonobacter sp. 13_2_20CM_53_11]OLB58919.1 MAG: acetylglutamate kinase [Ktedonobacter sp. 13_2_20CM_2_56_8]OLE09286.1 MAG: acetylglutamate kinase [Ktedonobacter sp. 13_1_20CM_4_53_11]OLE36149.1 MAG: acetylglutamate kinase [Ktedonobacter sp. 13_1_20CM_3_54_15]TMC38439.1 MAG: acetylglutamate kinase [Chloroflexota bacterium]
MSITFSITSEGDIINDHHLIAQVLREALPYIDFLKGKTLVVKLGGSALEYQRSVLQDIIWLRALGANPVLVHGGGPYINEWLKKLNLPARFEQGLRVTDAATLDVVRMVLLGQVNQGLVLMTSSLGGHAVGLSGTDGNMIRARVANERLGFVGEVESVDPLPVQTLIDQGYIPIIAPLGQGPDDTCLNINADLVAAHLAGALNAEKLIFLSNVVGICRQDGTLISELGELEAKKLIEDGVISGGMIPKVSACLDALLAVPRVHIVDGRESHILLRELFTDEGAGTMIRRGE